MIPTDVTLANGVKKKKGAKNNIQGFFKRQPVLKYVMTSLFGMANLKLAKTHGECLPHNCNDRYHQHYLVCLALVWLVFDFPGCFQS